MQACCYHTGVRYIEKDTSINKEFLNKQFGENASTVYRQVPHPFNSNKRQLPDLTVLYVIQGDTETELCSCPCHVNDPSIIIDH